jgi:hypothetical protein
LTLVLVLVWKFPSDLFFGNSIASSTSCWQVVVDYARYHSKEYNTRAKGMPLLCESLLSFLLSVFRVAEVVYQSWCTCWRGTATIYGRKTYFSCCSLSSSFSLPGSSGYETRRCIHDLISSLDYDLLAILMECGVDSNSPMVCLDSIDDLVLAHR